MSTEMEYLTEPKRRQLERRRQVLHLYNNGMSYRKIARHLKIGQATVNKDLAWSRRPENAELINQIDEQPPNTTDIISGLRNDKAQNKEDQHRIRRVKDDPLATYWESEIPELLKPDLKSELSANQILSTLEARHENLLPETKRSNAIRSLQKKMKTWRAQNNYPTSIARANTNYQKQNQPSHNPKTAANPADPRRPDMQDDYNPKVPLSLAQKALAIYDNRGEFAMLPYAMSHCRPEYESPPQDTNYSRNWLENGYLLLDDGSDLTANQPMNILSQPHLYTVWSAAMEAIEHICDPPNNKPIIKNPDTAYNLAPSLNAALRKAIGEAVASGYVRKYADIIEHISYKIEQDIAEATLNELPEREIKALIDHINSRRMATTQVYNPNQHQTK